MSRTSPVHLLTSLSSSSLLGSSLMPFNRATCQRRGDPQRAWHVSLTEDPGTFSYWWAEHLGTVLSMPLTHLAPLSSVAVLPTESSWKDSLKWAFIAKLKSAQSDQQFFCLFWSNEESCIQFQELIKLTHVHVVRWWPDSYDDMVSWGACCHTSFVRALQPHISLQAQKMHLRHMHCSSDNHNRHSLLWSPWVLDDHTSKWCNWECANTSLLRSPSDSSQM